MTAGLYVVPVVLRNTKRLPVTAAYLRIFAKSRLVKSIPSSGMLRVFLEYLSIYMKHVMPRTEKKKKV